MTQFCHIAGSLYGTLCGLMTGATLIVPYPVFDALNILRGVIGERYLLSFI